MNTVAVIDYGMGNLHSVAKALERVGSRNTAVRVTADARDIRAADRVVFPGVGAIRDCIGELKRLELDGVVRDVAKHKPLLCVCVGLQALFDSSEENGGTPCLGIVPGRVVFFGDGLRDPDSGARLKVPHMGWNEVHQERAHPLWTDIPQDARFYFVHSYHAQPADPGVVVGTTHYGTRLTAAIARDNIFAVQFHPEKSATAGLQIYANFLGWNGNAN